MSERGFTKRREPGTGRNRWYGLTLRDLGDDPNYCEQLGVHTEPRVVNSLEPLFVSDNGPVNSCEGNFRLNADKIDYIEGNRKTIHNHSQNLCEGVITDPGQVRELAEQLADQPFIGLDTETTGLDPHLEKLRLLQVSVPDRAWVIDTDMVPKESLRPA